MDQDTFIEEVRSRAQLASREEAERAIRATLELVARHLEPFLADQIAAQIPAGIGRWMMIPGRGQIGQPDDVHPEQRKAA